MRIGIFGDPNTASPLTEPSADICDSSEDPNATCHDSEPISDDLSGRGYPKSTRTQPISDPNEYYQWLSTELKHIHDAVKINREKVK